MADDVNDFRLIPSTESERKAENPWGGELQGIYGPQQSAQIRRESDENFRIYSVPKPEEVPDGLRLKFQNLKNTLKDGIKISDNVYIGIFPMPANPDPRVDALTAQPFQDRIPQNPKDMTFGVLRFKF